MFALSIARFVLLPLDLLTNVLLLPFYWGVLQVPFTLTPSERRFANQLVAPSNLITLGLRRSFYVLIKAKKKTNVLSCGYFTLVARNEGSGFRWGYHSMSPETTRAPPDVWLVTILSMSKEI